LTVFAAAEFTGIRLNPLLNEAGTRQKIPFISNPMHSVQPLMSAKSRLVFKEFTMTKSEQKRLGELYRKHLMALKLQGTSDKTIDAYSHCLAIPAPPPPSAMPN
jgi:hypothetical protein